MDPSGLIAVLFLIVLPLLVILAIMLRIWSKNGQRAEFLDRIRQTFVEAGAEVGEGNRYRKGDRIFSFDALISPIFSSRLSLRLSAWCDSVYEFLPQDIREGMAPELTLYLATVKEPYAKLCPGRWRFISKRHLEVVLSGNMFDPATYSADDLRSDLESLEALASQPLRRRIKGGVVTYREGFEKDLPAWHWTTEQRDRLPDGAKRFVFSYIVDNPYLNLAIVELLYRLSGDASKQFISHRAETDFLRNAFGKDTYKQSGLLLSADNPEVAVGADQFLDGDFLDGYLAGFDGDFGRPMRLKIFESMLGVMDRATFMARRLFDDEHSWYSGEYEIVSSVLTADEVRQAVLDMSTKHEARFLELKRRFHHRLLKGERLEELT